LPAVETMPSSAPSTATLSQPLEPRRSPTLRSTNVESGRGLPDNGRSSPQGTLPSSATASWWSATTVLRYHGESFHSLVIR
jgi:hypothetical protein